LEEKKRRFKAIEMNGVYREDLGFIRLVSDIRIGTDISNILNGT